MAADAQTQLAEFHSEVSAVKDSLREQKIQFDETVNFLLDQTAKFPQIHSDLEKLRLEIGDLKSSKADRLLEVDMSELKEEVARLQTMSTL